VYAQEAFGEATGFVVGWTCWTAALLSWAAVARVLPVYLAHLVPWAQGAAAEIGIAVGVTLVLGVINYIGVKPGAYTLDALTVAKLLPLLVLLAVGLGNLDTTRLVPFAPEGFGPLPRAAFLAMFAFQGFEVVPVPAGETHNPRRNAPLALFGSLLVATILYMAIQLAAVGSTPSLAGAKEPLALMGATLLGDTGARLVAGAAVVSMLGFCAGVALAGPRYLEALATDGHLPPALAHRHPRLGTPGRAVATSTLLTTLLLLVLDFNRLVDLAVLTVGFQYLATSLAVPALRHKRPEMPRAFRLPLGPFIPLCSAAVTVWFLAQAGSSEWFWLSVMTAGGVALWGAWRVMRP